MSIAATPADALLTDQYTLTMGQSFWLHGQDAEQASFELFVRRLPEPRGFLVAAGLERALDYLERLAFDREDLDYLESLGIYSPAYLERLSELRFTGSVDAVAEGTLLPAQAPILRVSAPRLEACLVESALLAIVNHETMVASKTARIVHAAAGAEVWDFSLRRLHGLGAAVATARAAYLAGAAGTATVAAGRDYGIPTAGTMAHHFIQSFGPEREQEAFEQFLRDYPEGTTLLPDTYDTARGIENAIAAARATGIAPKMLRLDSGDLDALSRLARSRLDATGFTETRLIASNDLDEYKIAELVASGAPLDAYGVGTMLGTSADAPNLGGVYKIVAQELAAGDGRPGAVMKLSLDKRTDPGRHQLWRSGPENFTLGLARESSPAGAEALLEPMLVDGRRRNDDADGLAAARRRCANNLAALPAIYKETSTPRQLTLARTPALQDLARSISSPAAAAIG